MPDYTPDLQGRAILVVSDYVDKDYDALDLEEEKKFLNKIEKELKEIGIDYYFIEFKNLDDLKVGLEKFDKDKIVIFNWAEELYNKPNTGHIIADFFDQNGYKYSGASTENLIVANDRNMFNKILRDNDVTVPRQYNLDDKEIKFPIIIKAKYEHGSFGLSKKSVIKNQEDLEKYLEEKKDKRGWELEKFLGEEFIIGDEFTISVWGNKKAEVLPLFCIRFESNKDDEFKIVDHGSKWNRDDPDYEGIYSDEATDVSKNLEKTLKDASLRAYKALNCRGIARFEMRVRDGLPYFTDFNPNPNMRPDSAFMKSAVVAGYNHGQIVAKLCEFALYV